MTILEAIVNNISIFYPPDPQIPRVQDQNLPPELNMAPMAARFCSPSPRSSPPGRGGRVLRSRDMSRLDLAIPSMVLCTKLTGILGCIYDISIFPWFLADGIFLSYTQTPAFPRELFFRLLTLSPSPTIWLVTGQRPAPEDNWRAQPFSFQK